MPEKDGSEDKKSTKSVVNRKQKQFMNQEEQLDLSSVAESFGGKIVGEPVELDEFAITGTAAAYYGIPALVTAIGAYGTARQLQGKPLIPTIPNLGIKDKSKKVFSKIQNIFKSKKKDGETQNEVKPDTETKPEVKPLKKPIRRRKTNPDKEVKPLKKPNPKKNPEPKENPNPKKTQPTKTPPTKTPPTKTPPTKTPPTKTPPTKTPPTKTPPPKTPTTKTPPAKTTPTKKPPS